MARAIQQLMVNNFQVRSVERVMVVRLVGFELAVRERRVAVGCFTAYGE
jgi:hypothetical protein